MSRIGDLIPRAAARLGLEDELRRARFLATFDAIVAERAPAAHGACRALRVEGETLVVEADAPIVGQELLLHGEALATSFRHGTGRRSRASAPGGGPAPVAGRHGRRPSIVVRSDAIIPAPTPAAWQRTVSGPPDPDEARCRPRRRARARFARYRRPRRAARRRPDADEGPPLPARHVASPGSARPGGDAPHRGLDPERVLLRRIGRDPGLPRQGDPGREQAAEPCPRARRPRQRPGPHRGGARGRPRQRAVRLHRRTGGGVSQPRGAAVDAARSAPRPRPALARPRAGRLARRDQRRRPAHARLAEHRRGPRRGGAQGRARHAPSPVGRGAPDDALPRRRRNGQRWRPGHRGGRDRGLARRRRAGPGPAGRAAGRCPGPLADPVGRHGCGRLRRGAVGCSLGARQGRWGVVPSPDAHPGRPAQSWRSRTGA